MAHIAKKHITCVVLLAVLALLTACFIMLYRYDSKVTDYGRKAEYLADSGYARTFGVLQLKYASIVRKYGEPIREELFSVPGLPDRNLIHMRYPSFDMVCVETTDTNGNVSRSLVMLKTVDTSLRFGRARIGVGSAKEDIHAAYGKDPLISDDELARCTLLYPEADEGFYGEDWCRILFDYDEHDVAQSLAYLPAVN